MACEEDSWGLREYVASNVAVPEELRPQRVAVLCVGNRLMLDDGVGLPSMTSLRRRMTFRITLSCWTLVACRLP